MVAGRVGTLTDAATAPSTAMCVSFKKKHYDSETSPNKKAQQHTDVEVHSLYRCFCLLSIFVFFLQHYEKKITERNIMIQRKHKDYLLNDLS